MSGQDLWTLEAMAAAMRARRAGPLPPAISGLSIDSRTAAKGDAFFAITGESRDGHDFVAAALGQGASLAVVSSARAAEMPKGAPLLIVDDVLKGLEDLARAARARSAARIAAITGSVGKTGSKEALRLALSAVGPTHASAASYNNHWGVPLSLARFPASAQFGVFELGMNHAGELTPLTKMVRPHVTMVTTVEPVHLEYFGSVEAIADAKAEIFLGVEKAGAAVLNRDNGQYARLAAAANAAGVERIVTFGEADGVDARLLKVALQGDCSIVTANILGSDVTYKLGAPGRHLVMNSLGVLASAVLLGADLALAAVALAQMQPPVGRGARSMLELPSGQALLIDESYNANPASIRAALALLAHAPVGPQGRRIAVLGDMLELGAQAGALHQGLAEPLRELGIDLVFCCGPCMRALWDALPPERRGVYAADSAALQSHVLNAIRAGDAVMVKGSLGSRMGPIVRALTALSSQNEARIQTPA
ncbi:MAG: UDP-N-acetylmuramoylalanyl-D-glutamyl-2,6-diaminopimelate--D-alanyl-D-alanine ligase [Variibacter sp.]